MIYNQNLFSIKNYYEEDIKGIFKNLLECFHVYQILPYFQAKICTQLDLWVNLIYYYMGLMVNFFIISESLNRISILIQKKIDEKRVKLI